MTRRKPRANLRAGLFEWQLDGDGITQPPTDNPRTRQCPACKALPGEPCTKPSRQGRIPLRRHYHPSRHLPTSNHTDPSDPQTHPTEPQ